MPRDPLADIFARAHVRAGQRRPGSFIPIALFPKQQEFVDCKADEVLFGGSSGGGKSYAALAAVLQHVGVPGYAGLILRRRLTDLALPGGLLDISHQWLTDTTAHYNGETRTWRFPSGARVTFGFIEAERDKYRYQGSQFQQIVLDEATQHPEGNYEFLFSRLRAPESVPVPTQMRCASNPGGEGHFWVRRRFIEEGEANGRVFIRSSLEDNPGINQDEYRKSLEKLGSVLRAQLLHGDWDVTPDGGLFDRSWFLTCRPEAVPRRVKWLRAWDRASSVPRKGMSDPDWTVGVKIGQHDGVYYIADVCRFRATSQGNEARIRRVAELDGRSCRIVLEQEPGSAGVDVVSHYTKRVLKGFTVKAIRPTGDKVERAQPLAAAAENGNLVLVQGGAWHDDFISELVSFPTAPHDDQVDAASLGFSQASYRPFRVRGLRVVDL